MGSRKRNKASELKEINKNKVFAKLNNCPTSPRKMRLVADQVRGKKVDMVIRNLSFAKQRIAFDIKKTQRLKDSFLEKKFMKIFYNKNILFFYA